MQQDCMRRRFDREPCSIARSLEILGDWWTLLIVRDAFLGVRRFVDFQARLGISKNILTRRLGHLTAHGVLAAVDAGVHGGRVGDLIRTADGEEEEGRGEPGGGADRSHGPRRISHVVMGSNDAAEGGHPLAGAPQLGQVWSSAA